MKIIEEQPVSQHNIIAKEIHEKFSSNSSEYTIETPLIITNPYKTAPLTALICFTTETATSCEVLVKGTSKNTDICYKIEGINTTHFIPVYGLYADSTNTVKITLIESNITSEYKIKTDPLPANMQPIEVEKQLESDEVQITFITDTFVRAFDQQGKIRWYLIEEITLPSISPICFLKNGNIAIMNNKLLHHLYYVSGIFEVSMLGKIENEFLVTGANHEILELNNGDLLVSCEKSNVTTEDYIVIIDRKTGEVKSDFDLKEILKIKPEGDITYQCCLYAYRKILDKDKDIADKQIQAEVKLKFMYDWLHMNSVYYNEAENFIIISSRVKDSVIKIDTTTKEIVWIFTDSNIGWCEELADKILKPTNFDTPNYCYGQHSAQIAPTGELIIFDNGNFRSKDIQKVISPNENYSRGVAYTIDEQAMTITQTFSYGENQSTYSCYLGNIEQINPNHYLINFGGIIYDTEGNFYDAPIVVSEEGILTKTVIVETTPTTLLAKYTTATNTYRTHRHPLC